VSEIQSAVLKGENIQDALISLVFGTLERCYRSSRAARPAGELWWFNDEVTLLFLLPRVKDCVARKENATGR
jgi:hypothetical protein